MSKVAFMLTLLACLGTMTGRADATISSFSPSHVPAPELIELLGVHRADDGRSVALIERDGGMVAVEVRSLETANRLIISGDPANVEAALELLRSFDVASKQIEISAAVIEVNRRQALDAGLDWDQIAERIGASVSYGYGRISDERRARDEEPYPDERTTATLLKDRQLNASVRADLAGSLHLLDASGAGRIRNTPRILTLNNRSATIMDGSKVTYVAKANGFVNVYETQTMDAGLKLEVLPTLGDDGNLTLAVHAELTRLDGEIGGSPVKTGQIVDNTIVAKDGEPVMLGGFQRRMDVKSRKRFPLLGHVLPFLFSRERTREEVWDTVIVLTARAVDPALGLTPETKMMLEDQPTKLAR